LRLEGARAEHGADAIEHALEDLSRVDETVGHLLAFARDAMSTEATVQLDVAVHQAVERWRVSASKQRRSVITTSSEQVTTRGSKASVDQILDVLIDNALHHGRGEIKLTQRRISGGGAVDVMDEGGIPPEDAERIFRRGHGDHHGIGLALARSIAEAEGGRLVLAHQRPTVFSLILLHPEEDE
jgi:signal transduction histidine kinase